MKLGVELPCLRKGDLGRIEQAVAIQTPAVARCRLKAGDDQRDCRRCTSVRQRRKPMVFREGIESPSNTRGDLSESASVITASTNSTIIVANCSCSSALTGLSGDRQRRCRPMYSCINVDTTMTKKVPNLNESSIERTKTRTISFELLYGLVILRHARRRLVSIRVTNNPTAEWIASQVTDAFPWDEAPRYLIRDRDGAFGPGYTRRIRAMQIRDHPTAPRSPWQNGHVEWLIGSIRRESLDHLIVFGEAHLRRILKAYASYYNEVRTHLSLDKDAPEFRRRQKIGRIAAIPHP